MTLDALRIWLNDNKIFFETVSASALSLMAIIVAIAQWVSAHQQTKLVSIQTRIAEAQALPRFEISFLQKQNSETGIYEENSAVIKNQGGGVSEFRAESVVFIRANVTDETNKIYKRDIPISGYFAAQFVSAAGTGELATMYGHRNNAIWGDLDRGASAIAKSKKWVYALFDLQIILRFTYRDLLGRSHEDFYQVSMVGPSLLLPEIEGRKIFNAWKQNVSLDISKLTAEMLLEMAKEAQAKH